MALGPQRPWVVASGREEQEDIPGHPFPLSQASDQREHLITCLSFVVQLHTKQTPNFSKLINFWKPGDVYGWPRDMAGAKVARKTMPPFLFH